MLQHAVECCAPETLPIPFPVSGRKSQKGLASGNIRLLTPPHFVASEPLATLSILSSTEFLFAKHCRQRVKRWIPDNIEFL